MTSLRHARLHIISICERGSEHAVVMSAVAFALRLSVLCDRDVSLGFAWRVRVGASWKKKSIDSGHMNQDEQLSKGNICFCVGHIMPLVHRML